MIFLNLVTLYLPLDSLVHFHEVEFCSFSKFLVYFLNLDGSIKSYESLRATWEKAKNDPVQNCKTARCLKVKVTCPIMIKNKLKPWKLTWSSSSRSSSSVWSEAKKQLIFFMSQLLKQLYKTTHLKFHLFWLY